MSNYGSEQSSEGIVEESIEIPNSGGARKSKLVPSGETIDFVYEDTKTLWDVVQRGCRMSDNGRCYGWRNSQSSYSWLTYNEFLKRAASFGSGLVKIGLKQGQSSSVGINARNCLEWVIAEYGCWSQSVIVVPLYDTLGPDACIFVIRQAETKVVICDKECNTRNLIMRRKEIPSLQYIITIFHLSEQLNHLANEAGIKIYSFSDIEDLGLKNPNEKLLPKPSDTCLICYTSGTTGDPKGAVIAHENIVSCVSATKLFMGKSSFRKEDTQISYLPLAHIYEQSIQALTLLSGGSIGLFNGDTTKIEDDMQILKPTFLSSVPRLLNKLYNKAQAKYKSTMKVDSSGGNPTSVTEKLINQRSVIEPFKESLGGNIRLIITGAAPIYENVLEFFSNALGCEIMEVYGQTECAGPACCSLSDCSYAGSVGSPVPSCIVKLVDVPDMGYLSKNSTGELCIRGRSVFKGYLKDAERTAEALDEKGWLHTGDIAMWLPFPKSWKHYNFNKHSKARTLFKTCKKLIKMKTHEKNGTLRIIDRKKNALKLSQGEYVAPEKIGSVYSSSPYVSQVYVHGDSFKSFLVAIVVPEKEAVLSWCKESSKSGTWIGFCRDEAVKQLVFEDMLRVGTSAELNSFEQVRDIYLHPEVMTFEAGFLTPTSKVKREVWKKYFSKEISLMCSSVNEYI